MNTLDMEQALSDLDMTEQERAASLFINDVLRAATQREVAPAQAISLFGTIASVIAQMEAKHGVGPLEERRAQMRVLFADGMNHETADIRLAQPAGGNA